MATVVNQPAAGGVTFETAKIAVALSAADSTKIEYGLDTDYGEVTEIQYAKYATHELSGLLENSVIHYRLDWWNGSSWSNGADRTFKTRDTDGTFSFLVLGDMKNDANAWNVYSGQTDSLLAQIKLESDVDFLVSVGDNIEIGVHPERRDSAWEYWHNHIDTMIIDKQIVLTMGNHDFSHEDMSKAVMDTAVAACRRAVPGYSSDSYQNFIWGDCAFIILNSFWRMGNFIKANIDSTELLWLRTLCYETLIDDPPNWGFCFSHHTICDTSASAEVWQTDPTYGGAMPGQYDSIWNFLDSANVRAYLAGHRHQWQDQGRYRNIHFLISGGGGGTLTDLKGGELIYHYLRMNVYPDSVRVFVKGTTGAKLDSLLITQNDFKYKKIVKKVKLNKVRL